jgi:hypothetical protein
LPENDLTLIAIQACNGRGLGVNTILGSQVATPLLPPKAIPMHFLAPRIVMSVAQATDRLRRK